MYESVLLLKGAEYLSTYDNQFGYKSCHSTDLCIYTLKEFIDYYKTRGTTVYIDGHESKPANSNFSIFFI